MADLSSHGEGGPFGIEGPDAEKTEGRAEQVGKLENSDGRVAGVGEVAALASPPDSSDARIVGIDVANLFCGTFGCAASGRWGDGGCSLTGLLRLAIVDAMLFLAASHQRRPSACL
ncbi:MAG: hypothetical protein ACI8RZ_006304 [Myxococcota bacterium]|jgi:hypothetical protein